MKNVIIVRYSEIYLKGKNRGFFERMFEENLEYALGDIPHKLIKNSGRYLIDGFDGPETDEIIERLEKVFGVHTISAAKEVKSDIDEILNAALADIDLDMSATFKVNTHRADKTFPLDSMEISSLIGGRILESRPSLSVDVHDPDFIVNIDVRENGTALVFSQYIKGAGGMPVGTAGKGMLLLSGGIDSPVAGHMIAKRGMKLTAVHFHSYPYTNLQARDKVIELAKKLSPYNGGIKLYIVKVTRIQEEIHKKCDNDYMVTILRRFMIRIADRLSKACGAKCLISGESLGQVASQTIEGMISSGSVTDMEILRPLCGFDKNEIIERAREIGTYDISVRPFEDCCTVFLPRHPVIHPRLEDVEAEEKKLDVDALVEEAVNGVETMKL